MRTYDLECDVATELADGAEPGCPECDNFWLTLEEADLSVGVYGGVHCEECGWNE